MSTSPFGILIAVELWVSLIHMILVRLVARACFGGVSWLSIGVQEAFRGVEKVVEGGLYGSAVDTPLLILQGQRKSRWGRSVTLGDLPLIHIGPLESW